MTNPIRHPNPQPKPLQPDSLTAELTEDSAAHRNFWDVEAPSYIAEHRHDLGDVELSWGPERLLERDAQLLGPLEELRRGRVLEVGCGAAQGSRWLLSQGIDVIGCDLSRGMLDQARRLDDESGICVPTVQADILKLPFEDASFTHVFTSYGAFPFVADLDTALRQVARVLCDGGRFVASVSHPVRWAFPDDPSERGLRADRPYFDRTPYTEHDEQGRLSYSEHHRTLGDWVRHLVAAGFTIVDLVEPEWSPHARTWGGWSKVRGEILPGTAIWCCTRQDR
ncbi:class I SAM-dependent methyltransferase [Devriesea agamarum]|uniref:class I SAM-dependent methyltransferase n=1 Tax=Devriesea agamarum TaxID=472569 RepID=UPI0009FC861C|nr:class I SAM-dependent methyltransferase [Devriesea agamarum]